MNMTKLWPFAYLYCLCFAFYSCDNSDPNKNAPQSVRLLGIEASINIDLSARKDWKLSVYNYTYAFEIEGGKLSAEPANFSDPYTFEITANDKRGRAIMTLMSPDYFKPGESSALPANIRDQSTPEKFLSCDVLRGDYNGQAKENIDVALFHENALLMFNTVDLPEDAEVYIYEDRNKQIITPLRDTEDPTSYKAFIFPQNYLFTVYVIVKINGKEYGKTLKPEVETRMNISYPDGIGHSAIITFNVLIDKEDKLQVEDLTLKKFQWTWPDVF